jgi:hypothetical protein
MRIWLTRLHEKISDAIRSWLFRDEIKSIAVIAYRTEWMADAALTYGKALVEIRDGLTALRDAEERHYRDLLNTQQEKEQKIDLLGAQMVVLIQQQTAQGALAADAAGRLEEGHKRLIELVEPKAQRLRDRAPAPPDWDEVQRQNLQQFEENKDGKPVRR